MEQLKKFERNTLAIAALAVAVVFLISLNILSAGVLKRTQLDLTEDHLFTLSDGTRKVLSTLDEPITLRFYLSRSLAQQSPVHANYAVRVRELLERYVQLSGGKVRLETYAPEPYSPQEDQAMASGLKGVQINAAGEMAYFGLAATNSTDDPKIIPFFDPAREPYLEYDLTKLVYSLAHPKKPVIGLLSSLPVVADPERQYLPWPVIQELRQFFTIRSVRASSVIPADIDVLMIVHPRRLTDPQVYGIDQFVLRGGKALIFVDPYFESQQRDYTKGPPKAEEIHSTLKPLFEAWGVEFRTDRVVGDREIAQSVDASSGERSIVTDYLPWLALRSGNFAKDDVVTSQIARINMASAGFFTTKPGATTKLTPLIETTPDSEQIDVEDVNFIPDPVSLLSRFKSENRQFVVAARLSGEAKSMYPDGPPWQNEGRSDDKAAADKGSETKEGARQDETGQAADKAAKPKYLTHSVKPINVMLVGDVDMLVDRFWLQTQNVYGRNVAVPVANNAEFVVNALDNLSGSEELISLRSRGLSYRPFVRTEEIRRDAEVRYRETERELTDKLKETENKLQQLRSGDTSSGATVLTDEQKAEIEKFRTEAVRLRAQLREVQHALRKDIESLDTWLKVINIWAMPALIGLVALVLWVGRRVQRRPGAGHA
ncbi:MAG: Gldg family protein [Alphaproteobacteria bacterium]